MTSFGKKKGACCCAGEMEERVAACACGGECAAKEARFIVLGACCAKSAQTFEHVKTAVREMGFAEEVLNIGDAMEIAKYGVMQTPALVVDGKVASYGRLLKVEDVKKILEKLAET